MPKADDLSGRRFGKLTASERVGRQGAHALWMCFCECGNTSLVTATNLKRGNSRSCGCLAAETARSRRMDITGHRYGRSVVLEMLDRRGGHSHVRCLCDCGTEFTSTLNQLRTGSQRSCGCLWRESITKHGMHNTNEYHIWEMMIQRCHNPKNRMYKHYGGRGISVDVRWKGPGGFEAFYSCLGQRPSKSHSIDRIRNDGNYEPGNVRWATRAEQARNRRNTRIIEYHGTALCLTDWATRIGISPTHLSKQLNRGRSLGEIIEFYS